MAKGNNRAGARGRAAELALRVVARAPAPGGAAALHPDTAAVLLGDVPAASGDRGVGWLQKAGGSDAPLMVKADTAVVPGELAMDEFQMYNTRVAAGDVVPFSVFEPPTGPDFDLVECYLELRLSELDESCAEGGHSEVDGSQLESVLGRQLVGHILAVNQHIPVNCKGHNLIARVARTESMDAEGREAAVGYHCFRGNFTPETAFYLSAEPVAEGSTRRQLSLRKQRLPPKDAVGSNKVAIRTVDDEEFLVHRQLLRPCISLTKVVRAEAGADGDGPPSASVDVDCLSFDRVLLFLEAAHLGREPPHVPAFQLEEMLQAARSLGLRSLEDHCMARLGELQTRVRLHSLDEVQERNAAGEMLILIDGMVLDVTRWLPEHPGGATIIPKQSLNVDATRFFELYHCTRESFLYLKELYIGELAPEDRHRLQAPQSSDVYDSPEPSADFLDQLHRYTPFRMEVKTVWKSF
mmetsp:Transcript_29493/g.75717  ORF Transcript_29493/g.75717 Transcript_29493/m.75717 type:complete len:467 (-) Transcript_29493:32-1432(-)